MHPSQVVTGGTAFLDALRVDAASCRATLRVQFSTFEGDAPGEELAAILLERAAAGVDVQVILDGYTDVVADDVYPLTFSRRRKVRAEQTRTAGLLARLVEGGIAVQRVAPAGRLYQYLLFRDHKKMVIIDDRIGYTGGINISEHNFAWHDFMVRLTGPVVDDLVTDFTSTWSGTTTALTRQCDDRDFALNQCPGRPTILRAALDLIEGARRSIVLQSPYLCGDHVERALLAAAHRGVHVQIIGAMRPNHVHNRVWIRKLRRRLHGANIDVLGYGSEGDMMHARMLIVEDTEAAFGSMNFQEIEALTQKELNVFTRDPRLVAELCARATADAAASAPAPRPALAFGWWTYRALFWFFRTWTKRLVTRPHWRAVYC
ncbi:MAG TPA: phosphatidylserine/phosphatidylglycerophosphate/cardiolipin synthase family protein [Acidimicrobiia bacterium]|nr:phosphatidylserine/phosphatidylglycerophosphate/cardiolipin synthase family protein [Acidimicrobiia bacterium]